MPITVQATKLIHVVRRVRHAHRVSVFVVATPVSVRMAHPTELIHVGWVRRFLP